MSSPSWAIIEVTATGRREALADLSSRGVPTRAFRRKPRSSPILGRSDFETELFPTHLWIHEVALPEGQRRMVLPGVVRVLLHEKGRPLCIPQSVVNHLDDYCRVTETRDVPPFLAMLDLLDGRERLWFVLETWASWPLLPQTTAESQGDWTKSINETAEQMVIQHV